MNGVVLQVGVRWPHILAYLCTLIYSDIKDADVLTHS